MAEALRNGDRIVDIDAGLRAGGATRHARADVIVRRDRLLAHLRVQLRRSRPLGAHLVDAGVGGDEAGVGAELEVGVGVLVVVLIVKAPAERDVQQAQQNSAGVLHFPPE